MPFKIQDTDYDFAPNLEEALDKLESDGFSLLAVIPGVKASSKGNLDAQPPKIVMHKNPYKDQVDEILALIAKLDRNQIEDLIDRMPDSVVDPICEMCDLSEEEFDEHLATTDHPSIFVQDANALVANSSDSNSDEIPW
jgi:hypothetical protein